MLQKKLKVIENGLMDQVWGVSILEESGSVIFPAEGAAGRNVREAAIEVVDGGSELLRFFNIIFLQMSSFIFPLMLSTQAVCACLLPASFLLIL